MAIEIAAQRFKENLLSGLNQLVREPTASEAEIWKAYNAWNEYINTKMGLSKPEIQNGKVRLAFEDHPELTVLSKFTPCNNIHGFAEGNLGAPKNLIGMLRKNAFRVPYLMEDRYKLRDDLHNLRIQDRTFLFTVGTSDSRELPWNLSRPVITMQIIFLGGDHPVAVTRRITETPEHQTISDDGWRPTTLEELNVVRSGFETALATLESLQNPHSHIYFPLFRRR